MYTLPEEVIDAIIEKQEQEEYEAYVEKLQYLDNNRMTVDRDAELSEYFDYEKYPDEQLYREEAIKTIEYLKEKYGKM